MDKYIGQVLDERYEIQDVIGVGGMANVYRAQDKKQNRTVAVKILREEFARNEEFLRRFRNESKAIAVLDHANIVKVYDVGFSGTVQYIVMECIGGITLKDYINQQKVVDWKEAAYFTCQILRGLEHAHQKGIVHRDIKPHNIMLLRDGTIKIMDFGIARFARSEARTLTDRAIGSVHYISPEQARGENTDARTDIYSVGVMLFEMLTGQLPFEADTPVSVALKQIQNEPEKPSQLNPQIPKGMEAITQRAMQKDSRSRYSSAADMLGELERFLAAPQEFVPAGGITSTQSEDEKVKKTGPSGRKKPLPVIPILTGIATAFVIATALFIFGMLYINNPFQSPDDIKVPLLVGLSYETVKDNPTYTENFDVQVVETAYQEGVEEGQIYHQEPKEGRTVKKGTTVTVKVSGGAKNLTMEDFSGQDAKSVVAKLQEQGFTVKETQIYHPSISPGSVVKTDPPAGDNLPEKAEVTVYVSMGSNNKQVEVPKLVDLTLEEAKAILDTYGLKLGDRKPVQNDQYANGKITSQEPKEGAMIAEGGRVNVEVSEGNTSMKRVAITVALPGDVTGKVKMEAWQDSNMKKEEELVPSQAGSWRVVFDGKGISTIEIHMNGQLYKRYQLDFDKGTHTEM